MYKTFFAACAGAALFLSVLGAKACTRILYETGEKSFIVGRTMDWAEDPHSDLWLFPKGMMRDGGIGKGSINWTSKHSSVISSFYNVATVDGMNDNGLVANVLYLVEADYGDQATSKKAKISIGAWAQYVLDNFATVDEAVSGLQKEPFVIIAPTLPNGAKASGHLALSDANGDSAIFEYLKGKLIIHHGPQYRVMTNSPSYDEQLAIETYWKDVGGLKFLPGTARSADRFARISWNLNAAPKEKDPRLATATAFSLIRAISVPLGIADPERPNIASTVWRTVSDSTEKLYYYESSYNPAIFWINIAKLISVSSGKALKLDLSKRPMLSGEVSDKFTPAEPFKFIAP